MVSGRDFLRPVEHESNWDSRYELELNNFQECGDEGEIWFGRSAENRMIDFVKKNVPMSAPILDLGCGNGSVLRRLRKFGYSHLTGVDYCPAAIELSKRISEEEVEDEAGTRIEFEVLDVLSSSREPFSVRFNVVLDKGTWDAMSLSADRVCIKQPFVGRQAAEWLVYYDAFLDSKAFLSRTASRRLQNNSR
ncbi:unnamed protein product [Nippostrongylus brasiliensis]|uniref:AT11165p (inferred by orthology to a D. melanogaster protein) n=1 Tax=Nippostrongylus brasiliensis TaxID=27835 RepID=A0A0N4XHP5_NIPBR|nr:unnamed protein product [Nippostrongylus brasiliensis]